MSERKVLNKYYPPDFDPSKIPRMKLARNRQYTVRLMAPFNMRCKTCGEYIYKGKKFNARKEDVEGDDYLGIRIYRFYIKCTRCLQEISFKTDPKNTDYEIEAGATRNFMALKLAEEQAQREEDEEKEEEATNPMKLLEKRTLQSKQELELLESLEELKDLNRRQQTIDYDQMLQQYDTDTARQRTEKEQEELDEQYIKSVFGKRQLTVVEEKVEEVKEKEEDEPVRKMFKIEETNDKEKEDSEHFSKSTKVSLWSENTGLSSNKKNLIKKNINIKINAKATHNKKASENVVLADSQLDETPNMMNTSDTTDIASKSTNKMHNIGIAYYAALLLLVAVTSTNSTKCSRIIESTTMSRSNAEGKYHFFMTLFNRTEIVYAYMPNTRYSVVLQTDSSDQIHRKFTRFLISAETENANETADVGLFDLQDDVMTKFADNCANAIMETSKVQKEEISVVWTSPTEGSGCILIRATVLETPDTWYMDDSNLVLNMCQDSKAEADDQGPVLAECCACDEAKYEVTFEGLWSRNTHPKDFPSKGWLIRFSDVIGASHTGDYRFWRYSNGISNGHAHAYMASIGLQQVAEAGTTRKLESELKDRSEHIRTIIKARGIAFPNVTGRTFAVFRVDRKHHLMSLVSKIDPSPDWIVGVSGLELCLSNCSWIIHKELNLYPYDAGTDDGITYMSPDSPTEPQELIRRITSTYPNDSRSPFYDSSGLDMKPLAKLYLNRQRLYEKTCDAGVILTDAGGDLNKKDKGCKVTLWGEWSACSVSCGRGTQLRQRRFRDEAAAHANKCITPITDRRPCYNAQSPYCTSNGRHDGLLDSEKCELTPWSSWSSCSSTCGEGSKTRSRNFRQKKYRKQCKAVPNGPELQQSFDCENEPCEGEDMEERCPENHYTNWSIWSPCSSSCGPGVKLRSRLHKGMYSDSNKDDSDSHEECKVQQASCVAEIPSCDLSREERIQICSEPMEKGRCNSNILRAYFDKQSGRCHLFSYSGCDGNRNNFPTEQDCNNVCGNFQSKEDFKGIQAGSQIMESSENSKVDCQVSEWSKWSRCENCRGYTISTRGTIPPKGGGKNCPKKLVRKKKCHKIPPCSLQGDGTGRRFHRDKNTGIEHEITVNCEVTSWSTWSECSATCGESLRTRVRSVTVKPRGSWARLCPVLAEFKKCRRVDCPQ